MKNYSVESIEKVLSGAIKIPDSFIKHKFCAIRMQDDTDGELGPKHQLRISFASNLDAFIGTGEEFNSLRFRHPFGGTISPHTYNALVILAIAIEMDKKQYPQNLK